MSGAGTRMTPVIREVYPYLCVQDAAAALDCYTRVFGAEELLRLTSPDGRIAHAELKLGPAVVMLVDEHPEYGIRSPLAFGGTGTTRGRSHGPARADRLRPR